jgi:uncharacterized protein YndB with AHSA1/START domain
MKKLNFSTQINASREKVWNILWTDATYRAWTSVFHEGSQAQSDWKEGSKILFVGSDGKNGMVSKIARLIPNEYMSFQHLGELKDGVEDFEIAKTQGWGDAFENYTLTAAGGEETELTVELDAENSFADYFQDKFPKALAKVKELAEKG